MATLAPSAAPRRSAADVDAVIEQYMDLVHDKDDAILRLSAEVQTSRGELAFETDQRRSAEDALEAEAHHHKRTKASLRAERESVTQLKAQLATTHDAIAEAQVSLEDIAAGVTRQRPRRSADLRDAVQHIATTVEGQAAELGGLFRRMAQNCESDEARARFTLASWARDDLCRIVIEAESDRRRVLVDSWRRSAWLTATDAFSTGGADDDDVLQEEFTRWSMAASLLRAIHISHDVIDQRNYLAAAAASTAQRALVTEDVAKRLIASSWGNMARWGHQCKEALMHSTLSEARFNAAQMEHERRGRRLDELQAHVGELSAKLSTTRAGLTRARSSDKARAEADPNRSAASNCCGGP
jgi:hypothetical protein